mmetsp:Transcript_21477/g.59715  ORF Transcript_21477/g.59715 Transcript_21477/m.59715 type:complete len:564 (-) Transcript_21477:434-2125(-)
MERTQIKNNTETHNTHLAAVQRKCRKIVYYLLILYNIELSNRSTDSNAVDTCTTNLRSNAPERPGRLQFIPRLVVVVVLALGFRQRFLALRIILAGGGRNRWPLVPGKSGSNAVGGLVANQFQQRTQVPFVSSPGLQAVLVDPLSHLCRGQRVDGLLFLVKVEHGIVPIEAGRIDDLLGHARHVVDHVFVANVRDAPRQFAVPVIHQVAVSVVQFRQARKVGRVIEGSRREFVFVGRKDGVHGLSDDVQNQGVRKEHVNEPNIVVIGEHLVRKALWICLLLAVRYSGPIYRRNHFPALSHFLYHSVRQGSNDGRERVCIPQEACLDDLVPDVIQLTVEYRVFTHSDNLRVGIEDSFQQRRAAANKSNDEDRDSGLAPDAAGPESLLEDLFRCGNFLFFEPGIPGWKGTHFVSVGLGKILPGRINVFGLDVVVQEHDVKETIEGPGDHDLPFCAVAARKDRVLLFQFRDHVVQFFDHGPPSDGHGAFASLEYPCQPGVNVQEHTQLVVFHYLDEVLRRALVLSENDAGGSTRCHGVQVHGFDIDCLAVGFDGHFKHVRHEIYLS